MAAFIASTSQGFDGEVVGYYFACYTIGSGSLLIIPVVCEGEAKLLYLKCFRSVEPIHSKVSITTSPSVLFL